MRRHKSAADGTWNGRHSDGACDRADAKSEPSLEALPLLLPDCRRFAIRADETGLEYEIFIYVPDLPAPPAGFPVFYVLDANADFVTVAETIRRVSRRSSATGICPAIVVGIGYPNTTSYAADRRYFDFTRGPAANASTDVPADGFGGQAAYVRFISRQLMPMIAARFPVHQTRRALLGHSLAGHFVLEVLAQQPSLFDGYVAFSPSIWWDQQRLVDSLSDSKTTDNLRLYVASGRWEQELAPWQSQTTLSASYHALRKQRRMVDNARDFAQKVEASFGANANVRFEIGEDEDHATIMTTLLTRALRFVATGWSD
ncbi:alpha/beta hydrolase (plasmid) [Rhizobium grahamii]|uniref:Alpha/beta hydrolase n=1 Tax=Rhizobium grahamii TaxID=1120045 RepID=A0A5Q0CHM0_9HYPH|nr:MULTISPECIES: alpha/beta hydrolase-fold protein [Rhizobium]QFY63749.1 alpha/beta hydrolase [Rhizobium grahamii]QRM51489.1 alpha/beta hydrolase [Rhizobium sp. BG6]